MRHSRRSKNLGREKAQRQQEALASAFDRKYISNLNSSVGASDRPQRDVEASERIQRAKKRQTQRAKLSVGKYTEWRTADEIKADQDKCLQGLIVSYK